MGQRDLDLSCRKGNNYRFPKHEAGRQVTWKSDVAASRVHLIKMEQKTLDEALHVHHCGDRA